MLLRQALQFLSRHKELEDLLLHNQLARQAISRFIAGDTRAEALAVARRLNDEGFLVSLDYLGDNGADNLTPGPQTAAEEYIQAVEEAGAQGLQTDISISLSLLGIRFDEDLAFERLRRIVNRAAAVDRFVRVGMEESDLTEKTFEMVRRVHAESGNIGAVVQSYLHRSSEDVDLLNREGIPVRLVRGSYLEPKDIAFQDPEEIDLYFMRLLEALFREGPRPALATHDEKLIEYAIDMAFIFGRTQAEYEIHLQYGSDSSLQQKLLQEGFRVRIRLSYGENWHGYLRRRLAERPANLWSLLKKSRH